MKDLGIKEFNYHSNTYTRRDKSYTVTDLIEASKDCEVFDLVLKGVDLGVCPWGEIDIKDIAEHIIRVNKADMQYPVILDDTGYICDGWHRVVKAIVNGDKSIKAVRLTVMPEPVK